MTGVADGNVLATDFFCTSVRCPKISEKTETLGGLKWNIWLQAALSTPLKIPPLKVSSKDCEMGLSPKAVEQYQSQSHWSYIPLSI